MPDAFQFDVFLSHSSRDKDVVRPLAERLRADGLRVWFDEWEIKYGQSIPGQIDQGLEHSRVLVFCMSANAFGSDWAQLERYTHQFLDPLNKNRRLLPLRLDDAPIKGTLKQARYFRWHPEDRDRDYEKLREECRRADALAAPPDAKRRRKGFPEPTTPRPAAKAPAAPNPFTPRGAITDPAQFFGRREELRRIGDFLKQGSSCSVVGPRRMGKSSLLLAVQRALVGWPVAYVDLHDSRCATLPGWLREVGKQWGWRADAVTTLPEFADAVEALVKSRGHAVLLLDEFEAFTTRQAIFHPDFFANLRALSQRGLGIVTASASRLSALTPEIAGSAFFNVFPTQLLKPFPPDEAEEFLMAHRPGVPPFTADERAQLLTFAGGHPFALQVAAYECHEGRHSGRPLADSLGAAKEELRDKLPDGWRRR